jgi:AcrR family transcriptional regulator
VAQLPDQVRFLSYRKGTNDSVEPQVSEPTDRRADLTRRHILHAAAHQFAHRNYSQVSLDDILADASVTKGAMYFHFRSKHALAIALIDEHTDVMRATVNDILARRLSALETLLDVSYAIAAQDLSEELARAGLNLIESVGRADGVQAKWLAQWIDSVTGFVQRAIVEGDIDEEVKPEVCARFMVALQMGLRQTSDLSDSHSFFIDLEQIWLVVIRGVVKPDRIAYMKQFIRRRTAVATNTVALRPDLL